MSIDREIVQFYGIEPKNFDKFFDLHLQTDATTVEEFWNIMERSGILSPEMSFQSA